MLPADFSVVSAWLMNYLLSVPDLPWQLGDQWKFWLHLCIRAPSTISWSKKFGLGHWGAKVQWINMMRQYTAGGPDCGYPTGVCCQKYAFTQDRRSQLERRCSSPTTPRVYELFHIPFKMLNCVKIAFLCQKNCHKRLKTKTTCSFHFRSKQVQNRASV